MKASLREQAEDDLRHIGGDARDSQLGRRMIMSNGQRTPCILAMRAANFSNYFWPGGRDKI